MDWVLAALGLVILLLAGDALVKGAVNLSLRLGVPALIVSLTIVAFGTSAPELLIAIRALHDGAPGLALGNVVGSNTANILLVLGIPAILTGLKTSSCDVRKSYFIMLAVSVLFIGLAFFGPITLVDGIILLAVLAFVMADQVRDTRKHLKNNSDAEDEEVEGADPEMPGWKIAVFLILGLIGLPLGADLLVDSGVRIARTFGVSETVIGLTLIALGTSLPELATTVMAGFRKQAEVALGNVLGSNMFNLLAIIGITSFFGQIPVDPVFLRVDLWVMLASALVLAPFVLLGRNMTRGPGIALTASYAAYMGYLLF